MSNLRYPRPVVFLDTETTGLGLDDPIWEIALIRREVDGTETRRVWHLSGDTPDERVVMPTTMPTQFAEDFEARYGKTHPISYKWDVARELEKMLSGRPYLVGAVPSFDTARIAHQLGVECWHYYLIDALNLATGWIAGHGYDGELPQKSDELSALVGIDPATYDRHTALGDVEWVRDLFDLVMGGEWPTPVAPVYHASRPVPEVTDPMAACYVCGGAAHPPVSDQGVVHDYVSNATAQQYFSQQPSDSAGGAEARYVSEHRPN